MISILLYQDLIITTILTARNNNKKIKKIKVLNNNKFPQNKKQKRHGVN